MLYIKKKIKSLPNLVKIIKILKKNRKKIVFTNGCFDLIHIGHTRYLKQAKKMGDCLVVGVNSDASVKRIKGPDRPLNSQSDRCEILSEFPFVDYLVVFNEDTPLNTIKAIVPDILVKGNDWKVKDIVGFDIVKANGGKVLNIPLVKGRSTTGLINKAGSKCKNK
jgi:D-beta-D-heptose 7-phosphate kinase/D-beta-D-heptose 1-phosphate adenosyltransferase